MPRTIAPSPSGALAPQEQVLKRETKRQQSQVLSEMGAVSNLSQEALHLLEAKEEQPAM